MAQSVKGYKNHTFHCSTSSFAYQIFSKYVIWESTLVALMKLSLKKVCKKIRQLDFFTFLKTLRFSSKFCQIGKAPLDEM